MAETIRAVAYGDDGDRHRFEERAPILRSSVGVRDGIDLDLTTDKTLFTPGVDQSGKAFDPLPEYDALLLYHPSLRTQWTPNVRQLEHLESFVEDGGGIVALHATLALLGEDSHHRRIADLLGGAIIEHGPPTTVRVAVEGDHPITEGVESFDVPDEAYDMDQDDDVAVLARVEHESIGDSASLWIKEEGEGRVCYCSNGHAPETFEDANVQRLLGNAVEWVAGGATGAV